MQITGKRIAAAASGAAMLATLGVTATPAASTAAPTAAAARTGWHCEHSKTTNDGDKGGSSGAIQRIWKNTSAYAIVQFDAKGEHLTYANLTSTSATGAVYLEKGHSNHFYRYKTFKIGTYPPVHHKDLSLREGTGVLIRVSIHNRGHCTSPRFTA